MLDPRIGNILGRWSQWHARSRVLRFLLLPNLYTLILRDVFLTLKCTKMIVLL